MVLVVLSGSSYQIAGELRKPGLEVLSVFVSVSPRSFKGECPKKFVFTGRITVKGSGELRYKWLRSDNTEFREKTLVFEGNGRHTGIVTTSWTLGATGKHYTGRWQALDVTYPVKKVSGKAYFSLICMKGARNYHSSRNKKD